MKPDFETTAQSRYQSQRELGRGEDTRVDLVYDQTRQLSLARKTWEHASAELRFRLRQQYRRSLNISHPNIVRVYDLSADNEHTFLTMEFVQGLEALEYSARLATHGASAEQCMGATLHLLQQLAAALSTLHKADIVHRALKPSNWLIEEGGRAVLLDAGLAWPPQRAAMDQPPTRAQGLPYVAPECLRGALHSVEADWYGLGALAFELITGQVPFKGSLESVLHAKDEPIESLRGACPIIPDDLDDLVLELLSRDPRARPEHEEIAAVLAALSGDFPFDPQAYCGAPPSKPSHVQLKATAVVDNSASSTLANVAESSAVILHATELQAEQPMNATDAERRGQLRHLSPALLDEPATLLVGEVADELAELVDDVLRTLPPRQLSNSQSVSEPGGDVITPEKADSLLAALKSEPEPEPEPEPAPLAALPALHEIKTDSPFDTALQQIITQLDSDEEPTLLCVRGAPGSGKSSLLAAVAKQLEGQPGVCARTHAEGKSLAALHELTAQLASVMADDLPSTLQAIEPAQRSALMRLCPALRTGADSMIDASAVNPQQRLIDAHLGLRALLRQLGARQRVLLCIDDADALDADTLAALRALLSVPVLPKLHVLITLDSMGTPADGLTALLDGLTDARPKSHVLELDAPEVRRSRPSLRPVPATESTSEPRDTERAADEDAQNAEIERLTALAREATEALALQQAAELYERALRVTQPPSAALLQQVALAHATAGRLRDAAKHWLTLARATSEPQRAQHFELEAAACYMRAGDEDQALSIMRSVLRNAGLHWPRTPLLTSTVERARALLRQSRGSSGSKASERPGQTAQTVLVSTPALRFEALWGIAKELVLHAPDISDALCARALREAQATGSRSQLLWALGYEATSEANMGGAFMQRRAASLTAEVRELADASASPYDLAYASSVEAVVSWFQGDWSDAEKRLRVALQAYTWVDAGAAQERHVLSNFLIGALEAQGKLGPLRDFLSEVRLAAMQTGHRQALALCELSSLGLLALAQDRPLQAIERADELLGTYAANTGFTPLHFQHFVVTANARLYAGHHAQAYQQVEQTWQQLRRTHLAQLEGVAMMVHQLRARAALALAAQGGEHEPERLRAQAHKLAGTLGRSNLPHVLALRHLIEANIAALTRHTSSAEAHCLRASELFDVADMPLYRETARMARGVAGEGVDARLDAAQSCALLAQAGVKHPARFVAGWFPALRAKLLDTSSAN